MPCETGLLALRRAMMIACFQKEGMSAEARDRLRKKQR